MRFFSLSLSLFKQGTHCIYTALADVYGNYELTDIPVREYYLLISSNSTRNDMTIDAYTEQTIKRLFSVKSYEGLELVLKLSKYKLIKVKLLLVWILKCL